MRVVVVVVVVVNERAKPDHPHARLVVGVGVWMEGEAGGDSTDVGRVILLMYAHTVIGAAACLTVLYTATRFVSVQAMVWSATSGWSWPTPVVYACMGY